MNVPGVAGRWFDLIEAMGVSRDEIFDCVYSCGVLKLREPELTFIAEQMLFAVTSKIFNPANYSTPSNLIEWAKRNAKLYGDIKVADSSPMLFDNYMMFKKIASLTYVNDK